MDIQEYDYYEVNAADVNLEEITSSAGNAKILQRLRDGDDELTCLILGMQEWHTFIISEGDDLGWLGYFIGKSQYLERLSIWSMPEGDQINAFVKGIARNNSVRDITIEFMSDDARAAIVRAVGNCSQLERLAFVGDENFGPNSHSALQTLLESGVCSLRTLSLYQSGDDVVTLSSSDDVVTSFANSFKSIAASLEVLELSENSIGNEGLLAVVAGLTNSTSLKKLDLSWNDFSLAGEGLSALSEWLQSLPVTLQLIGIQYCNINDDGMQAFAQGSAIHCRELDLEGNESITAAGLSCLSNSLQSESCCIEILDLRDIPSAIGEDGMKALARGLAHNTSLKSLRVGCIGIVPPAQWLSFSNALCDTSSVNSTYLSNHTIHAIMDEYEYDTYNFFRPEDIDLYLRLNEQHPKHVARCKILMTHPHLDMRCFLQYGLKFLPAALTWFEQAKTCTTLNVQVKRRKRRVVEESDKVFGSRVLSAMYEFVRGRPMQVMTSRNVLELTAVYDEKIAKIELENERLREIVESVRNSVGV